MLTQIEWVYFTMLLVGLSVPFVMFTWEMAKPSDNEES
jgi:hypothetical protein